jgi:DDE family transposase
LLEALMARTTGKALLDHFSALEDPRQAAKVLYPLPEIVLLLLGATLAGADDFVEIQLWGNRNLAFLRRFLPYRHGIPSHDTWARSSASSTPRCSRPASPPRSRRCARPSPT